MTLLALSVVVLSFSLVHGRPANTNAETALREYLTTYGYLVNNDVRTGDIRTDKELVDGIKLFQRYGGLKETGVVDADTLALMGTDRCGVADFSKSDRARRKRRYTITGVWKTKNLTYKIRSYTRKLPKPDQRAAFAKAFKRWQAVSQLNIRETNDDNADIIISFEREFHGDGRPFFSTTRKYAHAFYPRENRKMAGDVHFNDYVDWTLKSRRGVNLELVAVHEFGHSLGLGHTRSKADIMYPWYKKNKQKFALSDDDIRGIQHLYGKPAHFTTENPATAPTTQNPKSAQATYHRSTESPRSSTKALLTAQPTPTRDSHQRSTESPRSGIKTPVTPRPKPTPTPHHRSTESPRTNIQAPVTAQPTPTRDSHQRSTESPRSSIKTPVTPRPKPTPTPHHRSTESPRTNTQAPVTARPKPTRAPYLPDACTTSFDTFFMDAARRTYAFKGQYYWVIGRYAGLESGPHKIISRWRELRKPVDAAFTRNDGRTVFFIGSQYYIYYNNRRISGPRHIRNYGLPGELSNMDAVFIWGGNGVTYFFKGDQFWRYNDRKRRVFSGYPRKIKGSWKGIPAHLDGAMKWRNGRSYFFKGNQFYRINDHSIAVERNYPKTIGLGWMKCSKNVVNRQ